MKKNTGHDGISIMLLKSLGPLSELINMSLVHGIVPDEMKIAKVIPIFKAKIKNCLPIIDQYHFFQLYQKKFLKRWYIVVFTHF